jgi:hypothetical protein
LNKTDEIKKKTRTGLMSVKLTIDRRLSRQHDTDELQPFKVGLKVPEHRFNLVRTGGVLAEARTTSDGHAGVVADLLQLLREIPEEKEATNCSIDSFQCVKANI